MSNHKTKADIEKEVEHIKAAQRDPKHFRHLYDTYYRQIFLFIYKRVDDQAISADITSQVFYNALSHLPKFKFQGVPFSAWLYRIASNEANQYFRKTKAQRTISIEDAGIERLAPDLNNEYEEPKTELLVEVLNHLSTSEVELIELRYFENRSFKEIAYILGITETNAKVKTHRIVQKMRNYFSE